MSERTDNFWRGLGLAGIEPHHFNANEEPKGNAQMQLPTNRFIYIYIYIIVIIIIIIIVITIIIIYIYIELRGIEWNALICIVCLETESSGT